MEDGGGSMRRGRDRRGTVAVVALGILSVLALLGLTLLTVGQWDRVHSRDTLEGAEAFYVAEGGLQVVIGTLKARVNDTVRDVFPVVPGLLTEAAAWGLTAANFPGGIAFSNVREGQFRPNDPTSSAAVTIPGIGRGTARVTLWLKEAGTTAGDPVVFSVTSVGTIPHGPSRTVMADVTLVAREGRSPHPLQTGGLEGPVLGVLEAGKTVVSGTVLEAGAAVAVLKRAGNTWQEVGTATASGVPAGGPYPFDLELSSPLLPGEVYSAASIAGGVGLGAPAFPVVVR